MVRLFMMSPASPETERIDQECGMITTFNVSTQEGKSSRTLHKINTKITLK